MKPEVKEAIETIDREIERLVGERCDVFEVACRCCLAWRARDELVIVFESYAGVSDA